MDKEVVLTVNFVINKNRHILKLKLKKKEEEKEWANNSSHSYLSIVQDVNCNI